MTVFKWSEELSNFCFFQKRQTATSTYFIRCATKWCERKADNSKPNCKRVQRVQQAWQTAKKYLRAETSKQPLPEPLRNLGKNSGGGEPRRTGNRQRSSDVSLGILVRGSQKCQHTAAHARLQIQKPTSTNHDEPTSRRRLMSKHIELRGRSAHSDRNSRSARLRCSAAQRASGACGCRCCEA